MTVKHFCILLICFSILSCERNKILTIKDYAEVDELSTEIKKPEITDFIFLDSAWHKGIASGNENSVPDITSKPALIELVSLPDKKNLKPYTSIWYQKTIHADKDYILFVNPDDGAQVFLDSVYIESIEPDIYDLSEKTGKDSVTLTIRCMNQAMSGGLKEVKLLEKEQFEVYKNEVTLNNNLILIETKLQLLPGLEKEIKEIANKALTSRKETIVKSALKYLSKYPINLVDPFLQKTDSTIHIIWETDVKSTAQFFWGYDSTKLDNSISVQSDSLNMFRVSEKFDKGKAVYYQINYPTTKSHIYQFNSFNSDSTSKFIVWADSQSGWETFKKLSDITSHYPITFSIGVGDLVNNGKNEDEYRKLHRAHHAISSKFPVYLIPGNHDYDGNYDTFYARNFHKYSFNQYKNLKGNYFSFKEGNTMFIVLDPNENFPLGIPESSHQYEWFFEQLKSADWNNAKWRFILVHQPPFSQGWPGYHGTPSITKLLDPLYEKFKIDAVISGHTHDYERLSENFGDQTVEFIICGTAGGGIEPLNENSGWPVMDTIIKKHLFVYVELEKDTATFKAISIENKVIDKFQIIK